MVSKGVVIRRNSPFTPFNGIHSVYVITALNEEHGSAHTCRLFNEGRFIHNANGEMPMYLVVAYYDVLRSNCK